MYILTNGCEDPEHQSLNPSFNRFQITKAVVLKLSESKSSGLLFIDPVLVQVELLTAAAGLTLLDLFLHQMLILNAKIWSTQ